MLKEIPGREALQHICDKRRIYEPELDIFLHDVQPYAIAKKYGKFAGKIIFCPYCGVDIDKEPRP